MSEVSQETLKKWVEQFHTDGYFFLPEVLPRNWITALRADLDNALSENPVAVGGEIEHGRESRVTRLQKR